MQLSVIWLDDINSVLGDPTLVEQLPLILASGGRVVLTVAAILFVVYVLFMAAALVASLVRDWTRALLQRNEPLAFVEAEGRSVHVLAEQS